MHLMRSIPTSSTTTRQEYDVYRLNTPHATPEAHARMTAFYKNVVDEDFGLCEGVQRNLERGVFERGPLHPFYEEGAVAFQRMVVDMLREQVALEEGVGREVWASRPVEKGFGKKRVAGDENGSHEEDGKSVCETMLGCDKPMLKGVDW